MGYTKAILTLLFLLIIDIPTASAGWEDLLDDASSTAEDQSDYENSDWENYEDGIIDNFHFNKKLGYPEYDSGNYRSQNEINREVEIVLKDMPEESEISRDKNPKVSQ
ncbi:TPA: hypothetical protein HA351_08940 [Methanosarcinaceae archaeon]|nr:hypothetical protein [Methanosarcinaceae archaeon]